MIFGCPASILDMSKMFMNAICATSIGVIFSLIWLRYMKKKKIENTKVFFYNPLSEKNCKCRNNLDINCIASNCSITNTKEIIYCLKNATKSIDICVFTISNELIAHVIITAYKRGIFVRIIVSNCILLHSKEIKRFQNIGIIVKYQNDDQNSFMHNKFAVIDSTWLIHGSMNWTRQATFENWENFLITNKESLVQVFSENFEKIWLTI